MDEQIIITLIIQGVALFSTIYVSRKDTSNAKHDMDMSSDKALLKMDLKRLCDAIFDDVPYKKLKEIAKDIEENSRG